MMMKELESTSWERGPKADLSNSCALAPCHALNSSELCLELHPSALEQVLGQLKTLGQPALAQAAQVGALQNTVQAWWGLRMPMVPHGESRKSDTCLDAERRQEDALPLLHLSWHPEAEHTDAHPGNGTEELPLNSFISQVPKEHGVLP